MTLALKVEKKLKTKSVVMSQFCTKDRNIRGLATKTPSVPKMAPKTQTKSEGKQLQTTSTGTHQMRCFKCQSVGHIASKCPNAK